MTEDLKRFYAEFAPLYHLIYPDWDKSIERQAAMLDSIVRERWGDSGSCVLDVSCGIGTQSLGLAKLGYAVTASDLSREAVERAKVEAEKRDLSISFSVADMREAFRHHARQFDVVISCDNAIPHLLTDDDILTAFRQFYACTRAGGGCIISVRDYEKEDLSRQKIEPYGIRDENGVHYFLFQVWNPGERPSLYDVAVYVVEDRGKSDCRTHVFRSQYYGVGISRLVELMGEAGFDNVTRLDDRFFQPVIVGTRKSQAALR